MTEADLAEVGPWALDKLESLRKYLDFYGLVMKNQSWRTIYLDAFAGGGRALLRTGETPRLTTDLLGPVSVEERVVIDGSPRVALGIANPFDRYVLVDPSAKRVAELRALKAEFEGRHRIEVRMETASEGIDWVLSQRIAKSTHRGVAFLDPFGAGLDWASVEKLAKTRLFEVVVNFPLNMAIIRMMPNGGPDRETWSRKLDGLFGDRAWMDEVYEPRGGFFADTDPVKRSGYVTRLLTLYRSRLKGAFGFVSSPRLISNSRGSPLYYLLWAGPNKKGLEGAEHVLTMGKRLPKIAVKSA